MRNKVVCIKDWPETKSSSAYRGEIFPEKGEIYTIRQQHRYRDGTIGIRLVEIENEPQKYINSDTGALVFDECWFDSRHFREVQYGFGEAMAIIVQEEIQEISFKNG